MALCSMSVVAGVLGLVLVAKIVRGIVFRRRFGGAPCGMAFAGGGHDACGGVSWRGAPWRGMRHGIGRSVWLRALFHRLDTTPGQEREIRSALEELFLRAQDAKAQARTSRENLARAVAGETFDDAAFEATSARVDASVAQVKDAFRGALARIHGVLDARQRERLGALLANGWRSRRHGGGPAETPAAGPYRSPPEQIERDDDA